jgi:hypothetical protein
MTMGESPLNRDLQRELLLLMRDKYPGMTRETPEISDVGEQNIYINLKYLEEHGLCKPLLRQALDGKFAYGGSSITAKGLDFLEDDGGLSAILGIVTVKVHADTLREMLNNKIDSVPIAPEEKLSLKKIIRQLSETALKDTTSELVKIGLQHVPNIVELLRTIAGP